MKTSRKNLLITAGIVNFVFALISLYAAFASLFNWQDIRSVYVEYFSQQSASLNLTVTQLVTYCTVFLFLSCILNILFGIYYIYCSKLSYLNFTVKRQKLTYMMLTNVLLSIINISFIFILIALYMQETKEEVTELNVEYYNIQKNLYYKELINRDSRLFSMSEKIKKLKEQFNNNEITEHEYKNKLNEIISTGVN